MYEDQHKELYRQLQAGLLPQGLAGFAQARGMFAMSGIPQNHILNAVGPALNTERAIVVRDARNAIIPYQPTPREIVSALFLHLMTPQNFSALASTSGATNLFINSGIPMNCLLNVQPRGGQ